MADEEKVSAQTAQEITAASPKRKSRKGLITGIVILAIAAICVGFWCWHNTPGFCGNFCHSTMGEHLDNYLEGPGLAKVHADIPAGQALGCLDCHEATLDAQISEALAQISGNYGDLSLAGRYYVDNQKCLDCHGGTYDNLAKLTAALGDYNPHQSPHGQMNCNECHKGHAVQEDLCGFCHANGGQTMKG